ncbi:hypothetical protein LTR97_004691 [Elasticomyces elasticus]|uniref:Uncharacterized protein n=1 Tax=Elasticomyces elasticus TaxID=574655 RepID=A0AAN8A2L0_9PEZI|nr:hypothetical protein LTR97_004691 [Elasticomyces elasticus]
MKAGVVMVCPKQTEEVFDATTRQTITRTLTGHYVAEAVREWLGAPDLKAGAMHGGFIVKHPGSLPELLSQEDVDNIRRKLPPPMWKQREESGSNVKSWTIMIPRAKRA